MLGEALLADLPADLARAVPAARYALVTDAEVDRLHGDRVRAAFAAHNLPLQCYAIPAGEAHKTRATKAAVEDW